MSRRKRWVGLLIIAVVLIALVPIIIAETAVRGMNHRQPDPSYADWVVRETGARWKSVAITATDGAQLNGWLFMPHQANGSAVILLHGVNDSRLGMVGHAPYLLRAGFTVLIPDSRGQGVSGGSLMTYGIQESSDVHLWADRLFRDGSVQRLYGLGASMGAAILIQSLEKEPRFRSIVADSPFDTFEDIATYRLGQLSGLGKWITWPTAQAGFLYARWRYGVDLRKASPAASIARTRIPILLIHGTSDVNIPPAHSTKLHLLNPESTVLWLVPGVPHISALGAKTDEYVRRVLEWFRR